MSLRKLIFRSLRFYWRGHLGVLLGTILAGAILTGALVVGDSVRFSLRQMALARLGQTTLALTSRDRFFRADLAPELASRFQAPVAPLLRLRGAVSTPDGTHRANEVQVLGVDDRFWNFSPSPASGNHPTNQDASDEIAISESLASRLQLHPGDPLVVRLEPPSPVSRDLPLAGQSPASVAMRWRVRDILGDAQFGRFSLQGNQVPALSVFLPLNALQAQLQKPGRANVLLVGPRPPRCDVAAANAALAAVWTLSDANLELRELHEQNQLELRTERVFLDPLVADAALAVASNAVGVLTYFVNEIRLGDRATPYSFVAATSLRSAGVPPAGSPSVSLGDTGGETPPEPAAGDGRGTGAPFRDDEIAINSWLAEDLDAQPGSVVTLRYFVLGERRELQEQTATFRVREIIPLKADPTWMPEFPGLADTENCREWKPGIPIQLDRIRPKDETYWNQYRGTPKAWITLAAGQRLWANRFGNLTAIRFPAGGQTVLATSNQLERALLNKIEPAALGFAFTDVRERALQACDQSQDFGQLFVGFSFFLIVAALLLTALLFGFQLEQRQAQAGLLRALGFSERQVYWLFLAEGACVAGLGTLLGLLGGVAFTQLTLRGLATIWRGAVGTSNFFYHAEMSSLCTGAGLSLLAATGAMALALRGQTRRSLASLLATGAEVEIGGAGARGIRAHLARQFHSPTRRVRARGLQCSTLSPVGRVPPPGALTPIQDQCEKSGLGLAIGVAGWLGALVLLAIGGHGRGSDLAGIFFGSGLLLLCGGLGFTQRLLVRFSQAPKPAHSLAQLGWRNAGRRRARSLTTVGVLAAGVFLLVAVNAFRQNPRATALERHSGTGGFALYGQSSLPIYEDLNTDGGCAAFNLPDDALREVTVVPMRLRDGDDASCLNLNRAFQPRLFSVRPDELQRRQAFAFVQSLPQKVSAGLGTASAEPNAWNLLNQAPATDVVPAIGDEQTVRWALGKSLGDTIAYTDDRGRAFQIQIVGILANSILQGGLLISEPNFIARFPSIAGYRAFLVDAPPARTDAVAALLTRQLQDKGLEMQPAWLRLADFMAVENTYLGIFQALGGLGLLLGSLGLGIVVLRNVLERRQELALLQAVGFRPAQLQLLVLSEHWWLVVLGLVIGLGAAGLAVFPALSAADQTASPDTLFFILLALAIAGLAWCWLATRAALHGPLLEALRKE